MSEDKSPAFNNNGINPRVIILLYVTCIFANLFGHIDNGVFSVSGEDIQNKLGIE